MGPGSRGGARADRSPPSQQEKCHQYWPAERSARYQYFVVDPMAEYNMPQYILREFKVTDARVSMGRGGWEGLGPRAGLCSAPPREVEKASLVGGRSKGPGVGVSIGGWEEEERVLELNGHSYHHKGEERFVSRAGPTVERVPRCSLGNKAQGAVREGASGVSPGSSSLRSSVSQR